MVLKRIIYLKSSYLFILLLFFFKIDKILNTLNNTTTTILHSFICNLIRLEVTSSIQTS